MGNRVTSKIKSSELEYNADVAAENNAKPAATEQPPACKVLLYVFFVTKANLQEPDTKRIFYGIKGMEGRPDELIYLVITKLTSAQTSDTVEDLNNHEMMLDEIQSSDLFVNSFGRGVLSVLPRQGQHCIYRIDIPVLHTGAMYMLSMKFLQRVATTSSRRLSYHTKNYRIVAPVRLIELGKSLRPAVTGLIASEPPSNPMSLSKRSFRVDTETAIVLEGWWRASTESVKDKLFSLAKGSAGLAGTYAASGGVEKAVEGALGLFSKSRKIVSSFKLALKGAYRELKIAWSVKSGTVPEQASRLLGAVMSGLNSTQKISDIVDSSLTAAVVGAIHKTSR